MSGWANNALVIAIIPVALTALTALIGWLYRWHRENSNARALVASEILENYTMLGIFADGLKTNLNSNMRRPLASHFSEFYPYKPVWLRQRWESAPLGAFKTKEIYEISFWYSRLQSVTDMREHMAARAAVLRQRIEKIPEQQLPVEIKNISPAADWVIEGITHLQEFAEKLHSDGRPFVDKQVEKVYERLEAQGQTQVKNSIVGEMPQNGSA